MFEKEDETIRLLLERYFQENPLELFELNLRPQGSSGVIDILVDKPMGGISVDDCAALNKYLLREMEEKECFESFTLQVSSPGLDRPLLEKKDFLRVVNNKVQLFLKEDFHGRIQYDGILEEVKDKELLINMRQEPVAIPMELVHKGLVVL